MEKSYRSLKGKSITITKYWWLKDFYCSNALFNINFIAKKIINDKFFSRVGLKIIKKGGDCRPEEVSYITDESLISLRNEKISNFLGDYFSSCGIDIDSKFCLPLIEYYDSIFRKGEVSNLNGGMGYNNGLIFFILVSYFSPKSVIESGVWRGYTTLLLDGSTPSDCQLYCFDINLRNTEYRSTKAKYFESDINNIDNILFENFDFAFFDDHVSHYDRLCFCLKNNIKVVIMDDDVSIEQVHSDGWPPIPTAAMVFDYERIPHRFQWQTNGKCAEADIRNLEVKKIKDNYTHVRFPSLYQLTGYKDTSFTSVLVKK
ncbi:hypothetical protein [Vibrio viridaestus]|uniref:Uncharacterized protein n=1 Tax=Vibrio viridaestus TaxID=2487322 RepID=A0A3N9TFR6_9VIBR|nr:hypothetical protein [Vibrio viridaestus]RQW62315.1 hypothetical protein EES38_14135 [Vibrio viridaestus]